MCWKNFQALETKISWLPVLFQGLEKYNWENEPDPFCREELNAGAFFC